MKLTIIETGQVPAPLRDQFPDYPAMFRHMVGGVDSSFRFETISVVKGEALPDPAALDAVLYTGSPAGVYDPEPWIASLTDFIRQAASVQTPQVGICFGHQMMGEALGGQVVKSDKGWGVGRHTYEILQCPDWSAVPSPPSLRVAVSHQDQVLVCPPSATVIAASDFTPIAALSYGGFPALSFQCHPEFEPDYAAALYTARRAALGDEKTDTAVASLQGECDRRFLAEWIVSFLRAQKTGN